jgi:dipeptide/tripeptide permease
MAEEKPSWKFPATFWSASVIELFERAAYYGCFIFLAVYLTDRIGFSDRQTGAIAGVFSFLLYFLPTFMGTLADRTGFRKALCLAFLLLTAGYSVLAVFPSKPSALAALLLIVLGAAIVKPVISGTAAKCSNEANRARAFSLFYWAVNIGSFSGKSFVDPIRQAFLASPDSGWTGALRGLLGSPSGNGWELQFVNLYSACMAFVAFLITLAAFKDVDARGGDPPSLADLARRLLKALANVRFACLILITGLFWAIQGQLYATMPKYLFRMVGLSAKPGWIANVNPLVVILLVVPITHLVRSWRPVASIAVAFLIIPFSAVSVAQAPALGAREVSLGFAQVNTVLLMMVVGIFFQGLAECFLSPRYLEYASKQAPPGETGLYMGFSHLNTAFGWMLGFFMSGVLLERWCPDPAKLPPGLDEAARAAFYAHAHYIWYAFSLVGVAGFALLAVFRYVTDQAGKNREMPSISR